MLVPFKGISSIIRKLCIHWNSQPKMAKKTRDTSQSGQPCPTSKTEPRIKSSPVRGPSMSGSSRILWRRSWGSIILMRQTNGSVKKVMYNCICICTCCQCDVWNRYSNYQITTLIGPCMYVVCMAWHRGSFVKNTWGLGCFWGLWHPRLHKFDGCIGCFSFTGINKWMTQKQSLQGDLASA